MIIPLEVQFIAHSLIKQNYKAYLVGGAVRDLKLNINPKDWDIATTATPEQVQLLFDRTIPIGLQFGTVGVIVNNVIYEVTTLRAEGDYEDYRRPSKVIYTNLLQEDLSRRDFTINAMAFDFKSGQLIDLFNGIDDLEKKILRAVGNPSDRFKEDPLRMLRAIRIFSEKGFIIDFGTLCGIEDNYKLINKISKERVRDELIRILMGKSYINAIRILEGTRLLEEIIPEIKATYNFDQRNKYHTKDVYEHTIEVLKHTPAKLTVRLAALFHDIGKPDSFTIDEQGLGHFYDHHIIGAEITKNRLTELRFSNQTTDIVTILVSEHMSRFPKIRGKSIKKLMNRVGINNLSDLIDLQKADAQSRADLNSIKLIDELNEKINEILNYQEPLGLKDLDINGYDLMSIGINPDETMGKTLDYLLELVLDRPHLNTKIILLGLAKEYYNDRVLG